MKVKTKIAIILLVVLGISCFSGYNVFVKAFPKHRNIVVTEARSSNLNSLWSTDGYIEPNAKQEVQLGTNQKVIDVFATKGQMVAKGSPLIQLDSTDFQHSLNVENLNLEMAQRELKRLLKSNVDKKDAALAVAQKNADFQAIKADWEAAKEKVTQNKTFLDNGFISQEEYNTSLKNAQKLENEVKLTEMELQRSKEALTDFDVNRAEQIFKIQNNIKLIEENINSIKNKLDLSSNATIDGKVVKVEVEKNQYPQTAGPQIVVYDLSKYIVNVYVDQNNALYLKPGDTMKISVKGLEGNKYTGTIQEVDDMAVLSGNSGKEPKVKIKIGINNPDNLIKVGYQVEVTFDVNKSLNAITVSSDAIVYSPEGVPCVYILKDNVAQRKMVKIGIQTDTEIQILDGLIQGDRYIVNPSERIQSASSVKIRRYVLK